MSTDLKDKLDMEKIEKSSDTNEAVHLDDADSDESEELLKDNHKREIPITKNDRNKNFIKTRRSSRRRAASMKKRSLSRNGFNSSLGRANANITANLGRLKTDKKAQNRPQGLPSKKASDILLNVNVANNDKRADNIDNKELKTLSRGDL